MLSLILQGTLIVDWLPGWHLVKTLFNPLNPVILLKIDI